jgi:hypothetical protein
MKLVILLSLLISMAATFVPCCEFDGCQDEFNTSSRQNKKEQKGTCSPLSICSTCSGAVVVSRIVLLSEPLVVKNTFLEAKPFSILPDYFPSFWQPPRLS